MRSKTDDRYLFSGLQVTEKARAKCLSVLGVVTITAVNGIQEGILTTTGAIAVRPSRMESARAIEEVTMNALNVVDMNLVAEMGTIPAVAERRTAPTIPPLAGIDTTQTEIGEIAMIPVHETPIETGIGIAMSALVTLAEIAKVVDTIVATAVTMNWIATTIETGMIAVIVTVTGNATAPRSATRTMIVTVNEIGTETVIGMADAIWTDRATVLATETATATVTVTVTVTGIVIVTATVTEIGPSKVRVIVDAMGTVLGTRTLSGLVNSAMKRRILKIAYEMVVGETESIANALDHLLPPAEDHPSVLGSTT
mmetsp:Transcript_5238/g.10689  ORF Transcript_5238/g.10689 Transcript_5238/m.10689 type:complete len:312 (-) Transcript_5238:773-1708(-)